MNFFGKLHSSLGVDRQNGEPAGTPRTHIKTKREIGTAAELTACAARWVMAAG